MGKYVYVIEDIRTGQSYSVEADSVDKAKNFIVNKEIDVKKRDLELGRRISRD